MNVDQHQYRLAPVGTIQVSNFKIVPISFYRFLFCLDCPKKIRRFKLFHLKRSLHKVPWIYFALFAPIKLENLFADTGLNSPLRQ